MRVFPQTKLDSEINAPFLVNEHSDPTFYFVISIRTISSITEKKFALIYGYFLANEINTTEDDIMGPKTQVQIMFPLKDKKCRVFEDILSGT